MERMLHMVSVTMTAGMEKPIRVDLDDDRAGRMGSIGPRVLLRVDDMRYATMARRAAFDGVGCCFGGVVEGVGRGFGGWLEGGGRGRGWKALPRRGGAADVDAVEDYPGVGVGHASGP